MIKIDQLTRQFDEFTAVDNLSFDVSPGEVVGFLGPNGAGKSTTMKMITGFLPISSGSVTIFGHDIEESPEDVKRIIGYLPEGAPSYGDMTVVQFLSFIADIRGLSGEEKRVRIKDVVNSVQLESVLNRPIDNLSKGFKRRVGLAQAIIHDPKILILDEPTDGLDPNQKHHVRELIANLAKDKIVIVSTHILEEVTAVCNRAIIISQGKKLFDGDPATLEAKSGYHHAVTINFDQVPESLDVLEAVRNVERLTVNQNVVTVFPTDGEIIYHDVFDCIQQQTWNIHSIFAEKGRLDDVFRDMTALESN